MKTKIKIEKEVEIKWVFIRIPIRYGDEDVPFDFPLRVGDIWEASINIDSGEIENWPKGKSGNLYAKVCDEGYYELIDENDNSIGRIVDDYVPNDLIPGEYGDYVDLKIDKNGKITNWPQEPDVSEFFNNEE